MNIVAITPENVDEHTDDLIIMGDEFLEQVCDVPIRSAAESREILRAMVASAPTTTVLKMAADNGTPVGMSYYNFGSGYACGGTYLWLNSIYIRSEFRGRGHGSHLLDFIVEDGKAHGMTLFITCRDVGNDASRMLFERSGFAQKESVIMTK